jgi:hypothetical protein
MSFLDNLLGLIFLSVFFTVWTLGFVIAKGFAAFACIFPPYALYVVVEYAWNHVQLC